MLSPGRAKRRQPAAHQGDARIDHAPARGPDFHVPETTARNAASSMSAKWACGESEIVLVHVPEYSPPRPETVALQAPSQDWADLLADHPPCIRILPVASWSIHAPVAPPLGSGCAVQLPPRYPDCAVALQVPFRSAPQARMAEAKIIAKTRATSIVFNLSRASRAKGCGEWEMPTIANRESARPHSRLTAGAVVGYFAGANPWVNSMRTPQGSVRNAVFRCCALALCPTGPSNSTPSAFSFLYRASRSFTSNPM